MAKTATKNKIKSTPKKDAPTVYTGNFLTEFSEKIVNFKLNKKTYIILVIAGLLLLSVYKKEWFIAAMVNGQPVSNFELQVKLNQQFRNQTITQMVNEKIILDEATKNKALPTQSEINEKIAEIEKSYGGEQSFMSLLSQQGQTLADIKNQIMLSLAVEKLYGNEATVSASEIQNFIETNKDYLRATDSAGQQIEATTTLKQQKLSQIFSQKFKDLKEKANVKIF